MARQTAPAFEPYEPTNLKAWRVAELPLFNDVQVDRRDGVRLDKIDVSSVDSW